MVSESSSCVGRELSRTTKKRKGKTKKPVGNVFVFIFLKNAITPTPTRAAVFSKRVSYVMFFFSFCDTEKKRGSTRGRKGERSFLHRLIFFPLGPCIRRASLLFLVLFLTLIAEIAFLPHRISGKQDCLSLH